VTGYGSVTTQKKKKKEGDEVDTSLGKQLVLHMKEGSTRQLITLVSLLLKGYRIISFFREKANGANTPFAGATFNTGSGTRTM